jgi:hypothetical protein
MPSLKDPKVRVTLWVLASPVLLVKAMLRARRRYVFFRLAMKPSIYCKCGESVSLVGFWKCSCGFTYQGHLLRRCPVCYSVPCVVRCYRCGVTTKLPEHD